MVRVYSPDNPKENLRIFGENPYHGRFFLQGNIGKISVQGYGVESRHLETQNRIFVVENNIVSTEVFDPNMPIGDPELTFYDAMRPKGSTHIVSNGNQTDTALRYLRAGKSFEQAMRSRTYEPDNLHTPRISGFIDIDPQRRPRFGISIIRKNRLNDEPVHSFYSEKSIPAIVLRDTIAYGVQTYKGEPTAPESFNEPPFPIPLEDDSAEGILEMLWQNMPTDNRVAAAVKTINRKTGELIIRLKNKHSH